MLRNDHPFNPGEHKYSMALPIGGMILLGITCLTLGFVLWPEPKPHYDSTTEGTFPAASRAPVAGDREPEQPRERFQRDLDTLLAAPDPGNPEWQQKLLFSYNLLGSVEMGPDPEAARARFREGLETAKKLAATDPGNPAWLHEVVYFHGRLGDVEQVTGDHDAAEARYGEGLEVAKKLAALAPIKAPGDVAWQLDLVGAELKLVGIHVLQHEQAEARNHLAAASAVLARLEAAGLLRDELLAGKPYMAQVDTYRKAILAHERTLAEPAGK
jgi:hypothetical protein